MVLKVSKKGEEPKRRHNMEPRDMIIPRIQLKNHVLKKLTTLRSCLVVRLVHIMRGEEIRGNIPISVTLKSLRKPNYPLSMDKLKRGKKNKLGYLA